MKIKTLPLIILCFVISFSCLAQSRITKEINPICDSLNTLIENRLTIKPKLKLKLVKNIRHNRLNFYFTSSLGDLPWSKTDYLWFRKTIKQILPKKFAKYDIGDIYSDKINFNQLITPVLNNNGLPQPSNYTINDPINTYAPLVEKVGAIDFNKGLSGRYIALWQSHGRYYETKTHRWEWQRAANFTTVEDMYTQSYVLPFLIPMLENAGAYVMTPRERDTQKYEVITDNDPGFSEKRDSLIRREGYYSEIGNWDSAGVGFADKKLYYTGNGNPFEMGTARMAKCTNEEANAKAVWTPDIPQKGKYAVYISYKTLPNSSRYAHYVVKHLGGESNFIVNQRMGGGTWIYLGTFEFGKGTKGEVILDNGTPPNRKFISGSVITADAVKIGGGMGKIARGDKDAPLNTYKTSGLPSYTEAALYWMQWAGADTSLIRKFDNDYTNDYGDRGRWVSMMSGGSIVNPKEEGKGIPFDLSLAFHSDAGTSPNDSTIGTLAIYTRLCDGKSKFPNGENRMTSREMANYVQTQVVQDVRSQFNPIWSRRFLWDRSYSESRTPGVPAMILEILSHQNFADMRLGLDPRFRFTVSRAVYKGILKYLSNRYGFEYVVEPLPIHSFAAIIHKGKTIDLSWIATADSLEPTAISKSYILYTKINDGVYDSGKVLSNIKKKGNRLSVKIKIKTGNIYSYKIVAMNEGGLSFPSEELSVGIPDSPISKNKVLIVNNFNRISAPVWFDTPEYAGFNLKLDRGVPYKKEINYIGDMYEFRRNMPWLDDDNPGFGASYTNEAGRQYAGNTFNYPYIHGRAFLSAGYTFCSASSDAFEQIKSLQKEFWLTDLICGKEITTITGVGNKPPRFKVFPEKLQSAITNFTKNGGNMLVSGAYIGTDIWDEIYPMPIDSTLREKSIHFAENILGYKWVSNCASKKAEIDTVYCPIMNLSNIRNKISYQTLPSENIYNVESPDGIIPSNKNGATFLKYTDSNISAGVCYKGKNYKIISLGFPIETIRNNRDILSIIKTSLLFFNKSLADKKEKL